MTASTGRATSPEPDVDTGEAPPNLTGTVVSGAMWKAGTHIVSEGTRVVVAIVLARLLTPFDYGVAGMALVATSFALMFSDPSLSAALIQRPTITERDRSTVFWTAMGIGVLLTCLGVAASGAVARFFGEPTVRSLFIVTSLCFVLISLSVVPRALLTRRLRYRTLEIREMISIVSGGTVAILTAVAGFGPWAIVSNFVTYTVVSTVLVWLLVDWRPRFLYSRESIRTLGGFSAKVFSSAMLSWGNGNFDNVLVGRVLGPAALGAYSLAYNVMFMPMTRIGRPLGQVLSPAYSRIQRDRERLERAWLRGKRTVVSLVAPGFLAILVAAPDLVHVAFGSKWNSAITPLQLLCVAGVAHSLGMLNWGVLTASGAGGQLLRLTILVSAVTWTAFAVGLIWGIVGVAAAYAIARWLLVVPEAWITARAVGFSFWPTLVAGGGVIPVALAAAAVSFGVHELTVAAGAAPVVRLFSELAAMGVSYVLFMIVVMPAHVADIRRSLKQRSAAGAVTG
jgi:O-antigen/teichoic acid export membrane protein